MTNDDWKYKEYPSGSPAQHAQRLGWKLSNTGTYIGDEPSGRVIAWQDLVEAFSQAADAVVDQYVRDQKEKTQAIATERNEPYPITSSYYWANRLSAQLAAGTRTLDSMADEFRAAMAAAVEEYQQDQAKYASWGDARKGTSEAPEEQSETPHRVSAQSLIVYYNDGSELIIHTHHPMIQQHGWKVRQINGVPFLIFGHGVPRKMIPLCNVKSFDISEELL